MSKALIEKAFEKWKNDSGCRNNSCNDCQGGCNGAFIAGATWQREQLEAEIIKGRCKECRFISCCEDYLKAECGCGKFLAKLDLLDGEK
jgi:hypothetical protein